MKKTNRTYGVYATTADTAGRIGTGSKQEMHELFIKAVASSEYECVALIKWNEKYNCWYELQKNLTTI